MNKKHNSEKYFSGRYHYYLYLLLMRSVTAFIWISMCSLYANPSLGQNKIHVRFKNTPLTEVFSTLEKQTNYVFFYNDDVLKSANTITLDKDATLEEILNNALRSNNLTFDIIDKQVVVKKNKKKAEQLEYELTGKVTDKKGAPLVGVNVILKGKQSWDITRKEGEYRMMVSPYDTIIFSSLGYKTITVAVNNKRVIDATLVPDVMELHSVEIPASNGYTEIPKERATGAIEVIGAKDIAKVPTVDINARLEGKIAGVMVDPRTGNISVRGTTSYSGTSQPLVVIDGFPQSMNDFAFSRRGVSGSSILSFLNPDDIENITVLKDAAAASIWGSRAANGVIVVTTKKGRKSEEPVVSFSTTTTFGEKMDLSKLRVMNTAQYVDYEKDLVNGGFVADNISNWQAANPSAAQEIMFREKRGEITTAQRDQMLSSLSQRDNLGQINKYLLQNSITKQYDFSVSGGTDKSTYYLGLGYNEDDAAMKANNSKSYNVTLNNTFKLKSFLRLETGVNYLSSKYQTNITANEALSNVSTSALRPYDMLVDENGNSLDYYIKFRPEVIQDFDSKGYLPWTYNYIDQLGFSNVNTNGENIRLNARLVATITSWLNVETSGMYTSIFSKTRTLNELESYYTRNMINEATSIANGKLVYGVPLGATLGDTNQKNESQSLRFQMNINKSFNENNSLNFLAGAETREERREGSTQTRYGYNTDTNSNTAVNPTQYYNTVYGWSTYIGNFDTSISKYRDRYLSYYALGSYDFKNRYHLSGSVRFDDYNLLGASRRNRALPLWSVGAKWDVNKESFLKDVSWLSTLSTRVTYGKAGSAPAGGYGSNNAIIGLGGIDFYTQLPTGTISLPENPYIKWETTATFNVGLDYGVFNNRLRGNVDVYYKKTNDIITNLPFNPTYGWAFLRYNAGTLDGNGVDLGLSGTIFNGKFKWNSSFNFAYTNNEVTDSRFNATAANQYFGGSPITGLNVSYLYAYRWAGLDSNGQSQIYAKDGSIINSSQGINAVSKDDLKYMGTTVAPYFGGFMNDFSFKNFNLGVQVTYFMGAVFRNQLMQNYPSYSGVQYGAVAKDEIIADRWRQPGDEATTNVPGLTNINYNSLNRFQNSDINVLSADNIRLQQISLGYTVPNEWLEKTFFKSLSFNFAARNLGLLWVRNDEGIDPQYLSSNNYNTLAPQRTYTLQFNCSF
ncbi:SusC/RagA family TonB-linked outer membrane protein [Flavobacterium panacagri]|uniref:SusC/RagA family TonB-linked outer membrane protein n=1 Tax=Flavobacterium panacagri TaxID=3034146 RepID=UPI0025A4DB0F|nr:SusC/RagA family TonB-linked outer membrane protein [Flavobacterium panacagri]